MKKNIFCQIFAVATLSVVIGGCAEPGKLLQNDNSQTTLSPNHKSHLILNTAVEQTSGNLINAPLTKREALDYIFSKIHPQTEGIMNVTFHDGDFLGYEYVFQQTDGSLSTPWRISLYNDEQVTTDSTYYLFWNRELTDSYTYGNDYAVNIFTGEIIDFNNDNYLRELKKKVKLKDEDYDRKSIADYSVDFKSDEIRDLCRSLYRNLTYKNMIQEGDWGFFDQYREEYSRLLKGEVSFIYEPTGVLHDIDDLLSLMYINEADNSDFDTNNYFFDWSPDFETEIPQLNIYNFSPFPHRWVFVYHPQSDEFVMRKAETEFLYDLSNINHSYDKSGNFLFDIDYVDDETYKFIKEEYAKIDFGYEYKKGNPEVYDFYLDNFRRLMSGKVPFINPNTGEGLYISDLWWRGDFDLNEYSYEFFDMDGDNTPELYVLGNAVGYFFKYIPDTDSFILWREIYSYDRHFGSGKMDCDNLRGAKEFYTLDKIGNIEEVVSFIDIYEGRPVFAVYLPMFRNDIGELETAVLTEKMKEHAYYDEYTGYLFKVTKAQYNELLRDYFTAKESIPEEKHVLSYVELFGTK